jgi:hypothetical protein
MLVISSLSQTIVWTGWMAAVVARARELHRARPFDVTMW